MRYSKAVIIIISAAVLSCGLFQFKSGKKLTIVNKQELIKFKIDIDEVESVPHQGIFAKLYIKNIYHEKIEIQLPNCTQFAAPNVKYSNGYPVPMRGVIKETCEPEWRDLEPGVEFAIEYPYNLFHLYYLESGGLVSIQFYYFGEIRDSHPNFLSGNDDAIQSNLVKLRLVEN
jgi:hypothetical protein